MYGKKKKLDDKEWNKDETIKNTHTSINSYDLCSSK